MRDRETDAHLHKLKEHVDSVLGALLQVRGQSQVGGLGGEVLHSLLDSRLARVHTPFLLFCWLSSILDRGINRETGCYDTGRQPPTTVEATQRESIFKG